MCKTTNGREIRCKKKTLSQFSPRRHCSVQLSGLKDKADSLTKRRGIRRIFLFSQNTTGRVRCQNTSTLFKCFISLASYISHAFTLYFERENLWIALFNIRKWDFPFCHHNSSFHKLLINISKDNLQFHFRTETNLMYMKKSCLF